MASVGTGFPQPIASSPLLLPVARRRRFSVEHRCLLRAVPSQFRTQTRLDVWPTGDYGVRAGFARAWGLDELPDERGLAELGEPFAGSRSLVAWYCWRAIEAKDSART